LNPVGHQSTKLNVRCFLIAAIELLTSHGIISPLNIIVHAKYFPIVGLHVAKLLAGSKTDLVMEDTEKESYEYSSLDINGAKEEMKKCKRG